MNGIYHYLLLKGNAMATANELINNLLVELRSIKSNMHIVVPLISKLENLKINSELSDEAKKDAFHEAVLTVYSNEYVHTRLPGSLYSSVYSELTKTFHTILLSEIDSHGNLIDVKLDGIFEGDRKEKAGKNASQDTRIFASIKKTSFVSDEEKRRKINRLVDTIFNQAMTEAFLDTKYSKQTFVNAFKAIVRLGDVAISCWNTKVVLILGKDAPIELIIQPGDNNRSEAKFGANHTIIKLNFDFISKIQVLYWPQILIHLFIREERPKELDAPHHTTLATLIAELQKLVNVYESNPEKFDLDQFHTLVTQAYLIAFTSSVKSNGDMLTAHFDKVLKTFSEKTQNAFFGNDKITTYAAIAKTVRSSTERDMLVRAAFKATCDIFIDTSNAVNTNRTFIHAELFVDALGPEAIKLWNYKAVNFDPQHQVFPNLLMNRFQNPLPAITAHWEGIYREDFAALQAAMISIRTANTPLSTGSSLSRSPHSTTFRPVTPPPPEKAANTESNIPLPPPPLLSSMRSKSATEPLSVIVTPPPLPARP
jgi:hypothetical protein